MSRKQIIPGEYVGLAEALSGQYELISTGGQWSIVESDTRLSVAPLDSSGVPTISWSRYEDMIDRQLALIGKLKSAGVSYRESDRSLSLETLRGIHEHVGGLMGALASA